MARQEGEQRAGRIRKISGHNEAIRMNRADESDDAHAMFVEALSEHLWEIAEDLLRSGVDVNRCIDMLPLSLAAWAKDREAVRWLLERGADPNRYNEDLTTPLGCACDIDTVELMVNAGADAKFEAMALQERRYRGDPDRTSVHRAAEDGDVARLRLLIECANGRSTFGTSDYIDRTPLACAAHAGSLAAIELLLETGAHPDGLPDDEDSIPRTALQRALQNRHFPCAERLLKAGADPNLSIGLNTPAYEEACRVDCPPALLKRLEDALSLRKQLEPGLLVSEPPPNGGR